MDHVISTFVLGLGSVYTAHVTSQFIKWLKSIVLFLIFPIPFKTNGSHGITHHCLAMTSFMQMCKEQSVSKGHSLVGVYAFPSPEVPPRWQSVCVSQLL